MPTCGDGLGPDRRRADIVPTVPRRAAIPLLALAIAWLQGCAGGPTPRAEHQQPVVQQALIARFLDWRGTPYMLGGESRRGIDCSAFVQAMIRDLYGTALPRETDDQARAGRGVARHALRPGDLVFFRTGWVQRHVGIYVGDGEFIHASRSVGVTKSSLAEDYWSSRYWKARRVADT